jgi:GlpG protein
MRAIGQLQGESFARVFSDYLYVQGIDNQVEQEVSGAWTLWIHGEDQLEEARTMLAAYQSNPNDPKYRQDARAADNLRLEEEKKNEAFAKRMRDGSTLFRRLAAYGLGPVTLGLIIACGIVFAISWSGTRFPIDLLSISQEDIFHGQIWRLFTPMLLHFGLLHFIFNMLWLRDLGSMIEARFSGRYLLIFVLIISALSNTAQYLLSGPNFGGMSGVVYGLFGFIWMRGKYDPSSGVYLHPTTVTMMIIWFFLCFTGMVGQIANTVHAVGLVVGGLWGLVSSRLRNF